MFKILILLFAIIVSVMAIGPFREADLGRNLPGKLTLSNSIYRFNKTARYYCQFSSFDDET